VEVLPQKALCDGYPWFKPLRVGWFSAVHSLDADPKMRDNHR